MIEYIKGDITQSPELFLLHGCNAQGKMNSGVAKAIRDRWPNVFYDYSMEHELNGLELGAIYPCIVRDRVGFPVKIVVNAITQQNYGRDPNIVYVDYNAIYHALTLTRRLMDKFNQNVVAMPKIGAGLGNGDWDVILETIDTTLGDKWVKIYEY